MPGPSLSWLTGHVTCLLLAVLGQAWSQSLPLDTGQCTDPDNFLNGHILPANCPHLTGLDRGQPRSHFFTMDGKSQDLEVTVTPCGASVTWSLCSKPMAKRGRSSASNCSISMTGSTRQKLRLHTTSPAIFNLTLTSHRWQSVAQIHRTSVPSPFITPPSTAQVTAQLHKSRRVKLTWPPARGVVTYCVVVNTIGPMDTYCAVEAFKTGLRAPRPTNWDAPRPRRPTRHRKGKNPSIKAQPSRFLVHECFEHKTTYTFKVPTSNTRYFADVFMLDKHSGLSAAYPGTWLQMCQDGKRGASLRSKQTCENKKTKDCSCRQARKGKKKKKRFLSMRLDSKQTVNTKKYQGVKFRLTKDQKLGFRLTVSACSGRLVYRLVRKRDKKSLVGKARVKQFKSQVFPEAEDGTYILTFLGRRRKPGHVTLSLGPPDPFKLPRNTRVKAKRVTCSSARLQWEAMASAHSYCVYRMSKDAPKKATCPSLLVANKAERVSCAASVRGKRASLPVQDLSPHTKYRFYVFANTTSGDVPYRSVRIRTKKLC